MNAASLLWIIPIFVVVDTVIVWAIFTSLRGDWKSLERQFPPRVVSGTAVHRRYQSISIGMYNLGWSVHLTADEQCLHVHPTAYLRRLARAGVFSVPWEEVRIGRRRRWYASARIGREDFRIPRWVADLASPTIEDAA
ncbi:MAG: hypothetical protein KF768_08530 [Phycisphaeraceae bacterium]|nr:hypothetical protein [Phycisphaeraceae bacterium]